MKAIVVLLFTISGLWALNDPTYPLHEDGEYQCYVEDKSGKLVECQMWLFKERINDHQVKAHKFKRALRRDGQLLYTLRRIPVIEYEKTPVVLDLNQFAYVKLIRFYRPELVDQALAQPQTK